MGAQYDHPLTNGKLSFRLDGSYQGKLFTNAENSTWSKVDSRFLANAKVSWAREEDWKVSLEVQNLFDKVYYDALYDNGGFAVPGTRRRAILTATTRF